MSQGGLAAPERMVVAQVERGKDHDDANVHQQPRPQVMPEEQDIDSDDDAYHRQRIEHDGQVLSHAPCLSVETSGRRVIDVLGHPGRDAPSDGRDHHLGGAPARRTIESHQARWCSRHTFLLPTGEEHRKCAIASSFWLPGSRWD